MQQFRLSELLSYIAVQVGARQCTLMVVHVPAFVLRLDYTASCIDQAYACMLHVASPDLYRKCQYFICVY
jgi:hypothetical protein